MRAASLLQPAKPSPSAPASARRRMRLRQCRVASSAAEAAVADAPEAMRTRTDLRSVAIVAHVDHGKTTLVDAMLQQSRVFRDNQVVDKCIMDSNPLERERGITILSKNTSVTYGETKINIVDTPGHADFGGEVERVLNMVDGVLLLVDSVEGPMPQTRFVLQKALKMGHKVILVVNKMDREAAQPDEVVDRTFQLFCDLGATDEQCDFPIVYASGVAGIAGDEPGELQKDLVPLFESILAHVPAPVVDDAGPLQMLVTNLDYDEFKGRIALGRINRGTIAAGQAVKIGRGRLADETTGEGDGEHRPGAITDLFTFRDFKRAPIETAGAGDIVAITGIPDVMIGETIMCGVAPPSPLPTIVVEEPTVRMSFSVNTSPFAGKEGKFVTTRNIKDRLERELERNLALKVEAGATADIFIVSGRGALHLGILIETMRREGYEFLVGPPTVIERRGEKGERMEPYDECVVEAPEEVVSGVVAILNARKGVMESMEPALARGNTVVRYRIPTRGLLGARNAILTATKGAAVINTTFREYGARSGDIATRDNGSLVSMAQGPASTYALLSSQARGTLCVTPGTDVYSGMVIGLHQRPGDLDLNPCKTKAATNVRSNKDATEVLKEPIVMGLDDALEYVAPDEMVECTPKSIRICKNPNMRKKGGGSIGKQK